VVSLSPFLSPAALISGDSTGQSQARASEGEGGMRAGGDSRWSVIARVCA